MGGRESGGHGDRVSGLTPNMYSSVFQPQVLHVPHLLSLTLTQRGHNYISTIAHTKLRLKLLSHKKTRVPTMWQVLVQVLGVKQ